MDKYQHGQEVKFRFQIDLGDLISLEGIEAMNERADDEWDLLPDTNGFMLTDIGYNVVHSNPIKVDGPSHIGGDLTIEVTAILEEF